MTTTARITGTLAILVAVLPNSAAWADTFGNGENTFEIEFVRIGDPGNPADLSGAPSPVGSVAYAYRMGKFEISREMVDAANLWGGLGITRYNWGATKRLPTFRGTKLLDSLIGLNTSTGHTPAYKFAVQPGDAGYNANADIELWAPGDYGYNPKQLVPQSPR